MANELVHVKDSAMQERPICGFDRGIDSMGWTTRESMSALATCAECIHEVLMEKCGVCDGKGFSMDYDEEWPCRACDGENYIENRDAMLKAKAR